MYIMVIPLSLYSTGGSSAVPAGYLRGSVWRDAAVAGINRHWFGA